MTRHVQSVKMTVEGVWIIIAIVIAKASKAINALKKVRNTLMNCRTRFQWWA